MHGCGCNKFFKFWLAVSDSHPKCPRPHTMIGIFFFKWHLKELSVHYTVQYDKAFERGNILIFSGVRDT